MRVRVESPFPISAGLFKPVKQRRVAALGHTVHWYDVPLREIDTFLRSIYHHYRYAYNNDIHNAVQYQWYASVTIYYRGTTVPLNLSYSRLYHNPSYRLQFRKELSGDFGFYPASIEFWECDSQDGVRAFWNIRTILNAIIKGVTK
jgi:hypothetical protein